MILFYKDFFAENAFIDTDTKNKSFLKQALVLNRLGVKNNKFMLAILDRDLIGYDPHNLKDNSVELRQRIGVECKLNPWYFVREVVRIPVQGSAPIPFIAHRGNIALIWNYFNNFDVFIVMPRQFGKTVAAVAITAYIVFIQSTHFTFSMFAKDDKLRLLNVTRLKNVRDALPKYLISPAVGDSDNKQGLYYSALENHYQTFVAQKSKEAADAQARGMTTPAFHWDELGFSPNIDVTYPTALAATNQAAENAKEQGLPHKNIITCTAASLDTVPGRFAHSLITGAFTFSESMYDLKDRDAYEEIVKNNSANAMVNLTYSYLQLGKTKQWLKETVSRTKASPDEVARDYLNIWKSTSDDAVIASDLMDKILNSEMDAKHVEIDEGYLISWYLPEEVVTGNKFKFKSFILGMDSSENVGADFTSFVMIDASTMAVVATCRCNDSDILKVSKFICRFLTRFSRMLWVPERKSTGSSIIDIVVDYLVSHGENPLNRIFNKVVQDKNDERFRGKSINTFDISGANRKYLGFVTTASSRNTLYKEVLMKALTLNHSRIHDSTLIRELGHLTVRNGRIDHPNGGHDDTVVAYLLACFVLFLGKHLDMYCLRMEDVLSSVGDSGVDVDAVVKKEQETLVSKLNSLRAQLSEVSDSRKAALIERHIADIERLVDPDIVRVEPVNREQVIDKPSKYQNARQLASVLW